MFIFIVTKFGADCLLSNIYKYKPKANAAIFLNSRTNNSSSGQIGPMIELIQILLDIKILPRSGADWSIMQMIECKQSNVKVILNNGQITLTILTVGNHVTQQQKE